MMKRIFALCLSLLAAGVSAQECIPLDSRSGHIRWEVRPSEGDALPAVPAIVPGCVFASYVAAGVEADPNFGDNAYRTDKSRYDRNFRYTGLFPTPPVGEGRTLWLRFEGVNRKGTVRLNGHQLGHLDGFMQPGDYDITRLVAPDGENRLEVEVEWVGYPVPNFRSPTYISSAGWDWMPYAPGLLSGITDDVYLSLSGDVRLVEPWVRTKVPDREHAKVELLTDVENRSDKACEGVLRGEIRPGGIAFSHPVRLEAGERRTIRLTEREVPGLAVEHPQLWWPNGMGDPALYTCRLVFETDGRQSDARTVTFGIREYGYEWHDGIFRLKINGEPVYVKGGNWGMSEWLLRCRGEEYDTRVALHRHMHFNMIRNWIGSTTDEEFYDACDRHGIMIWDDFWLNSHPNLPHDLGAFQQNAVEKIKRLRNHPSIAVWCGNNEGWPEPPLDTYLRENVRVFDGGERYYQSNSHEGHLSGSGPWGAYDPRYYFTYYPYPYNKVGTPGWGFRTEIGTAVFVNAESFRKFIPEDKLWPRNEMWNLHYFGQQAFNGLPDQYERMLNERYGKAADIDDFCRKAQLLNIESNQALYEGWLDHMWEDASGIMTWMGQSAYPSLVWQTYDYYYDLTGAYWGCKRACEPLHILWNPVTNDVKITNTTSQTYEGLTATAEVFNTDGRRVDALTGTATVNSAPNTALRCFTIPFYKNVENIARDKRVVASSTDAGSPEEIVDGSEFTRWGSRYSDHEWIYIDLGSRMNVYGVGLNWENAFGKEFKIQISDDAEHWTDAAHERTGKAGKQDIFFDDVKGRYVKVQGIRRGTGYGYSLYEMKVYGGEEHQAGLSDVHLIRLTLRDAEGRVADRNTYWRGLKRTDFTALNTLPAPRLKVQQKGRTEGGKYVAEVKVTNLASSPAVSFATWVQLRHPRSGERILPALYDDNYFMLLPGETQTVHVEFDKELLGDAAQPVVSVTPYNDGR